MVLIFRFVAAVIPLILVGCISPTSSVYLDLVQTSPRNFTSKEALAEEFLAKFPNAIEISRDHDSKKTSLQFAYVTEEFVSRIFVENGAFYLIESPASNYKLTAFSSESAKTLIFGLTKILKSYGHEVEQKGPYNKWGFVD